MIKKPGPEPADCLLQVQLHVLFLSLSSRPEQAWRDFGVFTCVEAALWNSAQPISTNAGLVPRTERPLGERASPPELEHEG